MKNKKFTSVLYNTMKYNARVQVTLDKKRKPQALGTPSDFSEYTIKNFPGYKTQQ